MEFSLAYLPAEHDAALHMLVQLLFVPFTPFVKMLLFCGVFFGGEGGGGGGAA